MDVPPVYDSPFLAVAGRTMPLAKRLRSADVAERAELCMDMAEGFAVA